MSSSPRSSSSSRYHEVNKKEVSRKQRLANVIFGFLRFGTYRGHIISFEISTLTETQLIMTKCSWEITCEKIDLPSEKNYAPAPFSLLPALEDGYFSDIEIVADNGRSFNVHSLILKISCPDLDWTSKPPPLTGLPEDVLGKNPCIPSH